jgi:drug/metabolite transporter (DMT)-like permease
MLRPSMTPATALANRRGILALSAGMACFVSNDALVKLVSATLPTGQLIFLRGLFATALLFGALLAMGAGPHLRALGNRKVLMRAGFDTAGTVVYLTSLFQLPIGNATAINMAAPLFITLFAATVFREHVGRARWLAIAIGFTGVLLVVQPRGDAFNGYALLCVLATVLHAARDLSTRVIDRAIPSIVVTFSTALAVTLLTGLHALFVPWQPVTPTQLALLAAASVFLSGGYFLLTISMRAGEMSVIAPFRYSGLLFALVLGWVVWGDAPNALAWIGIALLVAAGLQVLHGERGRARAG